jgi:hypothetical protein
LAAKESRSFSLRTASRVSLPTIRKRKLVQHLFSNLADGKGTTGMVLVGDDVLPTERRALVAANVVTGEVRPILVETQPLAAGLITADENHVFVVFWNAAQGIAPQRILRTAWK